MTEQQYPFLDGKLDIEERVRDLVSRLTLEEKVELMVQYQPAVERLGVKPYKHGTEAAHGLAWLGEATSFPQPLGLGCTWNPELLKAIGSVIGDEARVYYQRDPEVNGLTLWAPTVDMERDPRWGRTEEAYGEDPKLTGELTTALVQGIQGDDPVFFKAVATLKHFIANNNEIDRGSCSASIDPRNMKEYYQRAFQPAFVKGGAQSMMTSYNSVNGIPTILHEDVNKVVKGEWGMNGFIVSDAGDLIGLVKDHHYYDTYKEAVAHSIKAGIDSITDDKEISCGAIHEALSEGLLAEADLDQALTNTFRVRFRLGEFDADNPYANVPDSVLCAPAHGDLSLQAARESIVLLKNEKATLPLSSSKLGSVAVIGPLGDVVYRDWYSGTFPYTVTPFAAIQQKLAGKKVTFTSGSNQVVLRSAADGAPVSLGDNGVLQVAAGSAAETFEVCDWGWNSLTLQSQSTGKFATSADDVHIAAAADEAYGWYVKEVLRLDAKADGTTDIVTWDDKPVVLKEQDGKQLLTVTEEVTEEDRAPEAAGDNAGGAANSGSGNNRDKEHKGAFRLDVTVDGIAAAVAAAREAETAIVFVGNNPLINGKEETDRPGFTLAAAQEQLLREVYAVNRNVIAVVIGSYPFELNWAQEHLPAVVYLAHAGQELGNAVADVLFGDFAPAGKLNMTWYSQMEQQLTDILDYDIIKGKRTYLYFEDTPLYPFGHGLTYAPFSFDSLQISPAETGEGWTASIRVTNTGSVEAGEVVQLYAHANASRVKRPVKQLVGFERVYLQPQESITVQIAISAAELSMWDVTRDRFCLESGVYSLMAGSSSSDIRLTAELSIEGESIPPRALMQLTRAENYDDYSGVLLDESKESGTCVRLADASNAGWIRLADVQWSAAPAAIEARVSGGPAGGTLTVRFGAAEAEQAAVLTVPAGGEQQWQTVSASLAAGISPQADVYLSLSGSVRLSSFIFS
ncbi:glycoside hydrolase family 3 C-terminal domain-containing protein [Paenibacillus sp. Leaf72]|uniref:glycoside hydrolase family 3 C-terminal domain-containing protein n=1 Tax=Paenibacillus sp. Leaf72 TaxID=1736234 RepID=UPI00070117BD|nr:glycoside hydrolase family 3 C-terminal domain-containing protein [Paenibacillus sp. Leaf72]KQN97815.1 beta-glucosidase [Paenibacillus sp. Leaf72]